MKKTLFALAALSTNVFAGSFKDYVEVIRSQRPNDTEKVNAIADITYDMVVHYVQAVRLGTTVEYEEATKIWHFNSFMDAADNKCSEDINLVNCIYDLVCADEVPHNMSDLYLRCD